ncbi:MAG: c-type cytochrome [Pirellulaceae bacterium]|nr:c-type cytochrome [Pirellulaceae bacterium]
MVKIVLFEIVVLAFIGIASGALNSQDSLEEFRLHPDCQMELVATEPAVVDPIAMRFDEFGRMWVVEMRDYPTLQGGQPDSQIKIIEDKDGDGIYESATVFANHLMFPTGIQPWKKGVIVTLAGKVLFLADLDGDGVCDQEKTLFTGFAEQNTQLRANHPTMGPDGLIYVANGLRNGSITGGKITTSLSINGMDFRFNPSTLVAESVTGYGQFGLTFDDAGYRFICTNRNPLKRVVLEDQYLKLAKGLPIGGAVADVAAASADSRLYPISSAWTTSNLHANQFTAACGVHVFSGNGLPENFSGNAFTCDPTANVVHREVISYRSNPIIGRSKPGRFQTEFLASKNTSFRPVNICTGPDGSLYVVDMRREVIEHPDFMPSELKNRPDLRNGDKSGRIYRISRKDNSAQQRLRFDLFQTDVLKQLLSENSWTRETAQRLILQSGDFSDFDGLRDILSMESAPPNSIIRALAVLSAKMQLKEADLEFPARHPSGQVRRFAVKQMETLDSDRLIEFIEDVDPAVRFQALLSCVWNGRKIDVDGLQHIAEKNGDNPWMRSVVLLASRNDPNALLAKLLGVNSSETGARLEPLALGLAKMVVSKNSQDETIALLDDCLFSTDVPSRLRRAVAETILVDVFRAGNLGRVRKRLVQSSLASKLGSWLSKEIEKQGANQTDFNLVALLFPGNPKLAQLSSDTGDPRQYNAVIALHFLTSDQPWITLAKRFHQSERFHRLEVLSASLGRPLIAKLVLEQVENSFVKPSEIEISTRKKLLNHSDPMVRTMANSVLSVSVPADRKVALTKYRAALDMPTQARAGRVIFEKKCSSCHQLGDLGRRIGPDISDTRTKTKSQLLQDIIQPNAAIDSHFLEVQIEHVDGRNFSGIIAEENSSAITLRQIGSNTGRGQQSDPLVVIPRKEIQRMGSTGKSLMPVGLEQDLTLQQMADLISFLKNWRYLNNQIPFSEQDNAK